MEKLRVCRSELFLSLTCWFKFLRERFFRFLYFQRLKKPPQRRFWFILQVPIMIFRNRIVRDREKPHHHKTKEYVFSEWMAFLLPYVVGRLMICWFFLHSPSFLIYEIIYYQKIFGNKLIFIFCKATYRHPPLTLLRTNFPRFFCTYRTARLAPLIPAGSRTPYLYNVALVLWFLTAK